MSREKMLGGIEGWVESKAINPATLRHIAMPSRI